MLLNYWLCCNKEMRKTKIESQLLDLIKGIKEPKYWL
jgi:hypothetical protein